MTVDRTRILLGDLISSLSDDEVEKLIAQYRLVCEVLVDSSVRLARQENEKSDIS